jgi:hypothetical protein
MPKFAGSVPAGSQRADVLSRPGVVPLSRPRSSFARRRVCRDRIPLPVQRRRGSRETAWNYGGLAYAECSGNPFRCSLALPAERVRLRKRSILAEDEAGKVMGLPPEGCYSLKLASLESCRCRARYWGHGRQTSRPNPTCKAHRRYCHRPV